MPGFWTRVRSAFRSPATSSPSAAEPAQTRLALAPPAADRQPRPVPRGGAGTSLWAGVIDDVDQNSEVRGALWYGEPGKIGIASRMVRDPHVRQSLDARTRPLLGALWDVEAASEDPRDIEAADFIRWNLFERIAWSEFLRRALLFHRDGFSLFEATDDVAAINTSRFPLHPGGGRGVALTGLHHRPAWSVWRWLQSERDPTQLAGVEQYIIGGDGEPAGYRTIPGDRLLRFTQEQEGANFAGLSTARSAYGPWKVKLTLMVLDAIRHERQGVGTPVLTLAEGQAAPADEEIDAATRILAEMRSHEKGFLILPGGYKFEWSSGGQSTNIGEAIERCNRDIAFNVAAGFMLLGLSGGNGSYALAQSQQGQYELSLEGDANFVADVLTRGSDGWSVVERLVRMNYGPDVGIPKVVVLNMPTRDWSKILPTVQQLVTTGVLTGDQRMETFARKVLRLPAHDPASARTANPVPGAAAPSAISGEMTAPADELGHDEPAPAAEDSDAPAGDEPLVDLDPSAVSSVADTALNGAQVTGALEIVDRVAVGRLPRDSGVELLMTCFQLARDRAEKIMGTVGAGFTPTPATPPPAPPPMGAGDEDDDDAGLEDEPAKEAA